MAMIGNSRLAGSTSVSEFIDIQSSADGDWKAALAYTDVTAYYCRPGAAPVSITLSALGAATSSWSSGGWFELDATNAKGSYRLDIPDAAFVAGVDFVEIYVSGTGIVTAKLKIPLNILNLDSSGNVTLKSGTHTGAIVPTVTAVTTVTLGSSERNSIADAIVARSLGTESYAADGAVPTLSQILLMIWSSLSDFDVSGTTKTSRKLDGSTSAMSWTLTLDGNGRPVSITRSS